LRRHQASAGKTSGLQSRVKLGAPSEAQLNKPHLQLERTALVQTLPSRGAASAGHESALIEQRTALVNQLQQALLEYYPAGLEASHRNPIQTKLLMPRANSG